MSAIRAIFRGRRVEPLWKHCLITFPLAAIPAAILLAITSLIVRLAGGSLAEAAAPDFQFNLVDFLGTVIVAPVFETLAMAVTLPLINLLTKRRVVLTAIFSGLMWGGVHALVAPMWFVAPAWAFFVLSLGYLAWREVSFRAAFVVACVPHMMNNAAAMGVLGLVGG